MAEAPPSFSTTPVPGGRGTSLWVGWIAFAALLMLVVGMLHVLQGLVALLDERYFVVSSAGLLVDVGYSAWGWLHLFTGAVIAVAGIFVLAGKLWARVVGTAMALASALMSMSFIAAYPVWSTFTIALDVMVVLALTVHGSEIKPRP